MHTPFHTGTYRSHYTRKDELGSQSWADNDRNSRTDMGATVNSYKVTRELRPEELSDTFLDRSR